MKMTAYVKKNSIGEFKAFVEWWLDWISNKATYSNEGDVVRVNIVLSSNDADEVDIHDAIVVLEAFEAWCNHKANSRMEGSL